MTLDMAKVIDLKDTRLLRVKAVRLAVSFLAGMCQLEEGHSIRLAGWPEGAVVLALRPYQAQLTNGGSETGIELIIHHPTFPIVREDQNPGLIALGIEHVRPVEHDTEAGC